MATPVRTAIVVYEGFDELDAIGPFEVLAAAAERGGPFAVTFVTLEPTDRVRASHGLVIEPDGVLDPSAVDLLIIPGGGWNDRSEAGAWTQVEAGALPEAVARTAAAGATVASVCTGGMILAHAGLLEGRPATTHAGARDDLATFTEVSDDRVVDDGDIVTAGGVTAGIDLALHLVERFADRDLAELVATELEYPRGQGRPVGTDTGAGDGAESDADPGTVGGR